MSQPVFPPPYSIRISGRAKHVGLRIRANTGLEIVLPKDFDPQGIPEILHKKRSWIEKHLKTTAIPDPAPIVPARIFFPAVNEHWRVRYVQTTESRYCIRQKKEYELSVEGPDQNPNHIHALLKNWLIWLGKKHLPHWLQQVQQTHNLPPIARIQIRAQKTRWASCSSKGTISLNAKLLFLEPETVEYIFIHELCHRIHMDHSSRFWHEVGSRIPDVHRHEARLKKVWQTMPHWTRQ